jgi:hypothetical protein
MPCHRRFRPARRNDSLHRTREGCADSGDAMRHILAAATAIAASLCAPLASAQTPEQTPQPPAETAVAGQEQPVYDYARLFPEQFPGVGFNMPKQTFLDMLASRGLASTSNSAKTMFGVSPAGAPFTQVVFFFNSNAGEILTEIEVRFADANAAKAWFDARYTPQSIDGDFFAADPALTYRAKAWQFGPKVYLVAAMLNTRWSNQ